MGPRAICRGLSLILVAFLLTGCFSQEPGPNGNGQELDKYTKIIYVMDTVVDVQVYAETRTQADSAIADVVSELERLHNLLTAHSTKSEVAQIALSAGVKPVKVSPETLAIISHALEYAERTGGAFDITLAPVLEEYSFLNKIRPGKRLLEEKLALVDWRKVEVNADAGTVYLPEPAMKIDLGGIAKGYITDRAGDILRSHGIQFGLVNSGGDIKFLGPKPDGTPWRVGIKNPDNSNVNFAIVEVMNDAVVTSGDYERFFDEDGVRYHHILDPASGLPANEARSVTVLAPSAELADLLSTAVFVMGPQSGLQLVNDLPDVEAIIWDRTGHVHYSSGLTRVPEGSSTAEYFFRLD